MFARALDWYLDTLGMIVSDFLFLDGQRDRGPTMAFVRCDQGSLAVDHHTLAMHLGPGNGYVHSAYQVTDLDSIAAGGEYLDERGYKRSWGIGRRHPGQPALRLLARPRPLHAGALRRRRPLLLRPRSRLGAHVHERARPVGTASTTRDFLGASPSPARIRDVFRALRGDNEMDPARLLGLLKAANS